MKTMRPKAYFVITSTLFVIVFILHALRLILGWDIVVDGVIIPEEISWLAVFLLGLLVYSGCDLFWKKK